MDEKLQPRLGKVLRIARMRLGLTQAEVARELGVVTDVYGRLERGDMLPSVSNLRRVCLLLGLSSDELLSLEHVEDEHSPRRPAILTEGPPEFRRLVGHLRDWSPGDLRLLYQLVIAMEEAKAARGDEPGLTWDFLGVPSSEG